MVLVIIVDILYYAGIGLHLNTSLNFFLPKYKNNHLFPFPDDTLKMKYLLKKKGKKSILGKLENSF